MVSFVLLQRAWQPQAVMPAANTSCEPIRYRSHTIPRMAPEGGEVS